MYDKQTTNDVTMKVSNCTVGRTLSDVRNYQLLAKSFEILFLTGLEHLTVIRFREIKSEIAENSA